MAFVLVVLIIMLTMIGSNNMVAPDIFPRIELGFVVLYFLIMVLFLFVVSSITARNIRNKGQCLVNVTKMIQEQQLEFDIDYTGVEEIDTILISLDKMRGALTESLASQWKLEQNKQKQMAALLHDLKTPITIMKANLYLMHYEKLSVEGNKSLEDMNISVVEVENYIMRLLETSFNRTEECFDFAKCDLCEIIDNVLLPMDILFREKSVEIKKEIGAKETYISVFNRMK